MPSRSTVSFAGAFGAASLALLLAGCDGSSGGGTTGETTTVSRPALLSVEYGRLVDVYSYRRTNQARPDRRDARFREATLMETNIVIDSDIESESLFDAVGGERFTANFRFLPFDPSVGHDRLLILWDDTDPIEGNKYKDALALATSNLESIPASYRNQNTSTRPIPVVPRNAAIKLNFDSNLDLAPNFFDANPGSLQLLRFIDDPNSVNAAAAFAPARYRVLPSGKSLVIDTTLIGGEAVGRVASTGLAPSSDRQTANFRIAIPLTGTASRAFRIESDPVPDLNDIDATGADAVIRDFRSGNVDDGRVAILADTTAPTIVGEFPMGITEVDETERVLAINKRGNFVAIRGRIPFVDGAVVPSTGLPGGRSTVPTVDASLNRAPLVAGDVIIQTVISPTGQAVTLRAEVVENLDVGSLVSDPNFPAPGLTAAGTDGGELPSTRVRVSSIEAFDSQGNRVTFEPSVNPIGADCVVRTHYYENVRYAGEYGISAAVSDTERRPEFIVIDPPPPVVSPSSDGAQRFVSPLTSIGLRFSEPMDIDRLDTLKNYVLTTEEVDISQYLPVLDSPKSATLSFLPSRIVDQAADGTVLKLLPPMGFFHEAGGEELYWFHAMLDEVQDLSGNSLNLFDLREPSEIEIDVRSGGAVSQVMVETPLSSFSVQIELDSAAEENLVGTRVYRFESSDEDGTAPGSIDLFGQFQLTDGKLVAAPTTRFSAVVDETTLSPITRFDKGECVGAGAFADELLGPDPFPTRGPGFLYQTPQVTFTRNMNFPTVFQPPGPPVNFGGIVEPHVRRGSRMQLTYREDDLALSMHDESQFNIDVEQLHWAPWSDAPVLFDEFDRYSILLGHSNKRPDLAFFFNDVTGLCDLDCSSLFSSLDEVFDANVLEGSQMKRVFEGKYTVNPALQFRTGNTKLAPYAPFQTTYTWRDSRLVTWDMETDLPVGLGGAIDAATLPPNGDRTASVSSPWCPDDPDNGIDPNTDGFIPGPGGFVRDRHDFLGDRSRDHDPIALPLLVEFRVFPDDTIDAAGSANLFWFGQLGKPYSDQPVNFDAGGYYNLNVPTNTAGRVDGQGTPTHAQCTQIPLPAFRRHSTGGIDPVSGQERLINPDNEDTARGGIVVDIGIGRLPHDGIATVPSGDGHVYWGQADFVRRVSVVTAGFFDTIRPNQHGLPLPGDGGELPALPPPEGRPTFDPSTMSVGDVEFLLDPPVQTGGATLTVELRGAERIGEGGAPDLYDPVADDDPESRGNLLNPNYACDAYRYANPSTNVRGDSSARIPVQGFTPYVPIQELDSIRDPQSDSLPRFLNYRIVMENNIKSTPTVSASLRNFSIVYRMKR